jgi:Protein of unknown function (DUF2891)
MPPATQRLDAVLAQKFAASALHCVDREYPNKMSHVLNRATDIASPRSLTPAFYGCYDWHSAVHNHWLLARLARLFPEASFAQAARERLRRSLSRENIRGEVAYLSGEGRQAFERPYGLAWLLQLAQELHEWNHTAARVLGENLHPLEDAAKVRLMQWLPKLPFPVRTGEHSQTAFALGLMVDYARERQDAGFLELLARRANAFYGNDRQWPLDFEPSGEDFLSPGLAEADLMRRVLAPQEFAAWFQEFLPLSAEKLQPVVSPDPSDPKFSHLDGLNLSRAWMLEGSASALPQDDSRRAALVAIAGAHAEAGLRAITGEHYVGSHWLGTFAVYLLTGRGIAGIVT